MKTEWIDTPWKVTNHAWRLMVWPLIRARFRWQGVAHGRGLRVFGFPIVQRHRKSTIMIGQGVELRSGYRTNPIAPVHPVFLTTRKAGASIHIGNYCGLTGTTIVAAESVTIGNRVAVGGNCTITDTDFHPLNPIERLRDFNAGRHKPVVIEDDVFIGMNCLILKGVTIGRGSVIGAGSVVSSDVPPGVIVAGNPAKTIRTL